MSCGNLPRRMFIKVYIVCVRLQLPPCASRGYKLSCASGLICSCCAVIELFCIDSEPLIR